MPTLPTVTVSDTQQARILDAFAARFGTTTAAETARAYKRWLVEQVRAVVVANEAQVMDEANNANKRSALASLEASLPDPGAVV